MSGSVSWFAALPVMGLCSLALTHWSMLIDNSPTSSTALNSSLAMSKCFLWSVRRQLWENGLLLFLEGHLLLAWAQLCHRPTARKSSPSSSHRLVWLGSRLSMTSQMELGNNGYMQALRAEKLCRLECLLREKALKGFTVCRASQKQTTAKEWLSSNGLTTLPVSVPRLLSQPCQRCSNSCVVIWGTGVHCSSKPSHPLRATTLR